MGCRSPITSIDSGLLNQPVHQIWGLMGIDFGRSSPAKDGCSIWEQPLGRVSGPLAPLAIGNKSEFQDMLDMLSFSFQVRRLL